MLLGLYQTDTADTLDRARLAPAAEILPPLSEEFRAAWEDGRRFAAVDYHDRNRHELVQEQLDRFQDATGRALPNPEDIQPDRRDQRDFQYGMIRQEFENYRQQNPSTDLSFPADDQIEAGALERARKARGDLEAVEAQRARAGGSFMGAAAGMAGGAAAGAFDPLNLLTMPLGVGAAAGILKAGIATAGIGAATQGANEALLFGERQKVDPNYSAREAVGNVAGAAIGGAVIGAGAKAIGKGVGAGLEWWRGRDLASLPREVQDAANVVERDAEVRAANPLGPTVAGEQAHVSAMTKAAQDLEAGRPVDVSAIVKEAQQIGDGYDRVRADPNGPADDPLIHIQPEDIESVIIGRGGFKGLGDVEVRGSGWGLVKFIWRHGEGSGKAAANQITRDDLVAFPEIIRTREATVETRSDGSVSREWRVNLPGPDGADRMVIFADGPVGGRQGQHLVTVFVQEPGRARGVREESALKTGPAGSPLEVRSPLRDTDQGVSIPPDGRAGPANENIGSNTSRVYTPSGKPVDVEYRVVEADTLTSSHGADGTVNPAFPADLQPRDRTRLASQTQIAEMAGQLQPERLGRSPDAATGAPIVGPDMVVESGNGRVGAIRSAYEQGGDAAARYREWVVGQDPAAEGMRNPVLVAVRKTEMDPAARGAFARDANGATAARMSPTELALADARRLDDAALGRLTSGDVTAAGNRGFVRSFLDRLPASERGSLVDASGALNQEGRKRIEGALLGKAYGDPAIIGRIVEDADSDIRAIGGALLDVAGPWAKLRAAVARGDLPAGMDVTADLLAAVRMVAEARASGRAVSELAQQMGLFGDDLSVVGRQLLAGLFRDEGLSKPAGRARVAEMLSGYLDEASKNSAGARLFGEPLTAEQIIRGERLTGEAPRPANDLARPAEEALAAPETNEALYHDVNRIMAARGPEIHVGETVDPETGQIVGVKRTAIDLMEEADRDLADIEHMAACVFGMVAE